jgi:hypothetical protein
MNWMEKAGDMIAGAWLSMNNTLGQWGRDVAAMVSEFGERVSNWAGDRGFNTNTEIAVNWALLAAGYDVPMMQMAAAGQGTTDTGMPAWGLPFAEMDRQNTENSVSFKLGSWIGEKVRGWFGGEDDSSTENYQDKFVKEMDKKIGTPYVRGGGNIPFFDGIPTQDEEGNYLGYDCVGGYVDSLRKSTGLYNIPPMEQNSLMNQPWMDPVNRDQLRPTDAIFVDDPARHGNRVGPVDHVMMYSGDKIYTTGAGGNGGYRSRPAEEVWKLYDDTVKFEYRRINYDKLFKTYGK